MNTLLHGTAAEMLVAADLMEKGFEVFHGLSGRESCDLIALAVEQKRLWRIEVKAGYMNQTSDRLYDVFAVANVRAKVVEYPSAPDEFINMCGEVDPQGVEGPKGLTARIRQLMRTGLQPSWAPMEVGKALDVPTRDCRERMRSCPTMHRDDVTGRYYLDEHLR